MAGPRRNYSKMAKKAAKSLPKSNGVKQMKPVLNPAISKAVKRIMHRASEIKTVTTTVFPVPGADGLIKSSGINNTVTPQLGMTSLLSIIPPVGQGAGQGQRIGNKISPVSLLVRGVINALPTTSSTGSNFYTNQPLYVRVVIYALNSSATTNVNDNLLDQGTLNKNFDGTLSDLLLPYNTERFKIVKSFQVNLQPPYDPNVGNVENANKRTSAMFKYYLPLPSTLTYADNVNDNNKVRYYMAAGVVNFDGNLLGSNDIRAKIWTETVLKFRDD